MSISVIDPIKRAMSRTGLVLFRPFAIGKWFTLAFCAFLAAITEFVTSLFGQIGNLGGAVPSGNPLTWIQDNPWLFLAIVGCTVALFIILNALMKWISCRGTFMFIHGIVQNRGEIIGPWKEFRTLGNSLFIVVFLVDLIFVILSLLIFALAYVIAQPDIDNNTFGTRAIVGVSVLGGLTTILLLGYWLTMWFLDALIAPVMYLRRQRIGLAWTACRREILSGHLGTMFLFLIMSALIGISLMILAMIISLLTCCLTSIPYLNSVILLPLLVFGRCYPLCFIEQFGPQWQIFKSGDRTYCHMCGYDLRGSPEIGLCPECGAHFDLSEEMTPAPDVFDVNDLGNQNKETEN
jgi:hypothetical protein